MSFLSGPIRNDSTRHADKKYVRIRFRGETLIRLSTIKFAKHYNLTSTLDLVHGARRVPRETRATMAYVALEVFSDRSTENDSSINLLTRS